MPSIHSILAVIGFAILFPASIYAVLALVAVLGWQLRRQRVSKPLQLPAVTVLKPLCGDEPGLYESLRSFCIQDFPQFQIVFGVRDPGDAALSVVRRLALEFPALPIDVVVDARQHGSNLKISNLMNMMPLARHDVLAMADSDTRVGSDYLTSVTAPLLNQNVGLVNCIYHGVPTGGIWSRLGAMYCNEWYMPSVLLSRLLRYEGYVSGQTMCLRRATLQSIGGFGAVANQLADDYRLGELVRASGLRVLLSPYVLDAYHHEPNSTSLIQHELRWMRTLRLLRPRSFCLLFLTFSLPLAVLGIVLATSQRVLLTAASMLFVTTLSVRLVLHFAPRLRGDRPLLADFWLIPMRDLLICYVWCRSFFSSRVAWRGKEFDVGSDGVMRPIAESAK